MDSLLASYASSDEETDSPPPPSKSAPIAEQRQPQNDEVTFSSKRVGLFSSLPPPRSSLLNSIPPPKFKSHPQNPNLESQDEELAENPKPKSSTSLFSALPPPKSSTSSSAGKKVVQFRPPTVTAPKVGSLDDLDDDEDEDELLKKRKRSKESISTTSSASHSFVLPAPRHSATLGALGSGRRSMLETDVSSSATRVALSESVFSKDQSNEVGNIHSGGVTSGSVVSSHVGDYSDQHNTNYDYSSGLGDEEYAYGGSYGPDTVGIDAGVDYGSGSAENVEYTYGNGENVVYSNYDGGYEDYGNWANATTIPDPSVVAESVVHVPGKRGRRDDPSQIIEVKQAELIKDRPREDQVKLTGIAFGPAYQPTSSKGKPSKLHKRKHQIGSLFFDMKQKEMELAERRARGLLTKAQTQGKYGW